jgi:hypothetical protein
MMKSHRTGRALLEMWKRSGVLILPFLVILGCMETSVDEGLEVLMPSITLVWPTTGDTLVCGQREIQYDLREPQGVKFYELFVNDSLHNAFPTGADGKKPKILWTVDTSLAGTRAQYYIKAYDIDGNTVTSPSMTDIVVVPLTGSPAAPGSLTLWRFAASSVNLSWQDASDNESRFEVWRKLGTDSYVMIQSLPANSISANDTGFVAGVVVRYRVRAVNTYGFSESNEVSTGSDAVVLNAPTNLMTAPLGTRRVELQWTDNSAGELGFVIQRRVTSGTVFSQIGMVGPNETVFIDTTGLVGGSSYTYRVAARGQFGLSGWSNEESALTLYQDISPPTTLSATYSALPKSVRLVWRDNTVLEDETRVERRTNPAGGFAEIGMTGTDTTTYVDSTVQYGFTYTYRVRARTLDGHFSAYSNEATLTIPSSVGTPGSALPGIGGEESLHVPSVPGRARADAIRPRRMR